MSGSPLVAAADASMRPSRLQSLRWSWKTSSLAPRGVVESQVALTTLPWRREVGGTDAPMVFLEGLSRVRGRPGPLPFSLRVKGRGGVQIASEKRRNPWTSLSQH
jgi:hypothetical protein